MTGKFVKYDLDVEIFRSVVQLMASMLNHASGQQLARNQFACSVRVAMSFTQELSVSIVLMYCESISYAKCQEHFSNALPDAKVPKQSSICRLFHRFRDTGSVNDRNKTGRPSVLTDDSLQTISETFIYSPKKISSKTFSPD